MIHQVCTIDTKVSSDKDNKYKPTHHEKESNILPETEQEQQQHISKTCEQPTL